MSSHLFDPVDKLSLMLTCKYICKTNSLLDSSLVEFRKVVRICYKAMGGYSPCLDDAVSILVERFANDENSVESLSLLIYLHELDEVARVGLKLDLGECFEDINTRLWDDANKLIQFYSAIGYDSAQDFVELFCYLNYTEELPEIGGLRIYKFFLKNIDKMDNVFNFAERSVLEDPEPKGKVSKDDWLLMLK